MKRIVIALTLVTLIAPTCLLAKEKQPNQTPVVWGTLTQSSGCVIFAEGRKTTGKYWGVAVTTKTIGKLTVIDTVNYAFDQKEILETPENMDALMQRAQKDRAKYVKIPEKYSPELLEKARAMCSQDQ